MKGNKWSLAPAFFFGSGPRPAFSLWSILLFLVLVPARSFADGITGYLDYSYSSLHSETKLATGETSSIKSETFNQQYNVTVVRTIYPNLRLLVNGIFEKDITKTNIDGVDTTSTTTIRRPLIDLTLKTPLYLAGLNYTRRDNKNETIGSPAITTVNEQHSAVFGWLPVGFPSVDLRLSRTNTYDKARVFQDTAEDFSQLTSAYEPMKNLLLKYQGSYRDTNNKLGLIETKELSNNGRVNYDGSFFSNRVTVSTSLDVTKRNTSIITSHTGEVNFPVVPFEGLFLTNDILGLDTLNPAPFLVDHDRVGTGGNLIDVGFLAPTLAGTNRNIGLNFGSIVEVNALRIWVDRALQFGTSSVFSWTIYTSSDNLHWTGPFPVSSATFDLFDNRFEIRFSNMSAQYIKVVTTPIPIVAQANADHIYVTEIEALIFKPVESVKGSTASTNEIFNFYAKTRILDTPLLFYDTSYFLARSTGIVSTMRSTLSNGLSLSHTFNDVLSGTARAAREDSKDPQGATSAYLYTAALRAVPFRTLSHSLTYSGRSEKNPQGNLTRNTIFLYNTADLYKGVSMYLGGGYSLSTLETTREETNTSVSLGSNIVPNEKITLTLNYNSSVTDDTGAGLPATSTSTQRGDLTIAYHPFKTLYAVVTLSRVIQNNKSDTLQNYSFDWSPFPGGALQLTFNFNENLRAEDNSVDRIIRPGLRWNITKRSFLDIAYLVTSSKSDIQKVNSKILSAELRIPF